MKYLGYKFEGMTTIELFAEPIAALEAGGADRMVRAPLRRPPVSPGYFLLFKDSLLSVTSAFSTNR
jgi:hypothetical protein